MTKKKRKPAPAPESIPDGFAHVGEMYYAIGKILVGKSAHDQGAVLAMVAGTWLSGHLALDKAGAIDWPNTFAIRASIMTEHTKFIFSFARADDETREQANSGPTKRD